MAIPSGNPVLKLARIGIVDTVIAAQLAADVTAAQDSRTVARTAEGGLIMALSFCHRDPEGDPSNNDQQSTSRFDADARQPSEPGNNAEDFAGVAADPHKTGISHSDHPPAAGRRQDGCSGPAASNTGMQTAAGPHPQRPAWFDRALIAEIGFLGRFARSLRVRPDDVDDLVQATIVRALAKWHRFEPGTSLRAWTATVLRNLRMDQIRRAVVAEAHLRASAAPASTPAVQEARVLIAEALVLAGSARPIIETAINDVSYDDTARRLGIPAGTVKSRLSRARAQLRQAIDQGGSPRDRREIDRGTTALVAALLVAAPGPVARLGDR